MAREIRIGDEVWVHGYVDEIRKDCIIIRNDGGYFGTVPSEMFYYEEDRNGYGTMNEADTPQTDCEIAKAIVHNAIDNTAIAEDVYPDLRQRLHDAVEKTPQANCKTCKHKGESWCGEHCYNCYAKDGYEPQTDGKRTDE